MAESVYRIVEFVRVVCPKCGNARVPVQRTERVWSSKPPLRVVAVVRHHVCGGCGLRFQSQEAPATTENTEHTEGERETRAGDVAAGAAAGAGESGRGPGRKGARLEPGDPRGRGRGAGGDKGKGKR